MERTIDPPRSKLRSRRRVVPATRCVCERLSHTGTIYVTALHVYAALIEGEGHEQRVRHRCHCRRLLLLLIGLVVGGIHSQRSPRQLQLLVVDVVARGDTHADTNRKFPASACPVSPTKRFLPRATFPAARPGHAWWPPLRIGHWWETISHSVSVCVCVEQQQQQQLPTINQSIKCCSSVSLQAGCRRCQWISLVTKGMRR